MAGTDPHAPKSSLSPLGAFVVGLLLGAGILFVYHAKLFNQMRGEVEKLKQDTARLEKVRSELNALLARMEIVESKPGAPPSKQRGVTPPVPHE